MFINYLSNFFFFLLFFNIFIFYVNYEQLVNVPEGVERKRSLMTNLRIEILKRSSYFLPVKMKLLIKKKTINYSLVIS